MMLKSMHIVIWVKGNFDIRTIMMSQISNESAHFACKFFLMGQKIMQIPEQTVEDSLYLYHVCSGN